jgi:hypothetical protein
MKELNEISNRNPFTIPENYFEEATRKIISSTAGNHSEVKVRSIYSKLRPYFAVAASIAFLSLLSYTAIHFINKTKTAERAPEISLNEFSENYLNDIDNLTLEENVGSIEQIVTSINLNSKDIIDYLVLENIDINDIYGQL